MIRNVMTLENGRLNDQTPNPRSAATHTLILIGATQGRRKCRIDQHTMILPSVYLLFAPIHLGSLHPGDRRHLKGWASSLPVQIARACIQSMGRPFLSGVQFSIRDGLTGGGLTLRAPKRLRIIHTRNAQQAS
jgi:hypothetical protein